MQHGLTEKKNESKSSNIWRAPRYISNLVFNKYLLSLLYYYYAGINNMQPDFL